MEYSKEDLMEAKSNAAGFQYGRRGSQSALLNRIYPDLSGCAY